VPKPPPRHEADQGLEERRHEGKTRRGNVKKLRSKKPSFD
jgi:hypothetical protein